MGRAEFPPCRSTPRAGAGSSVTADGAMSAGRRTGEETAWGSSRRLPGVTRRAAVLPTRRATWAEGRGLHQSQPDYSTQSVAAQRAISGVRDRAVLRPASHQSVPYSIAPGHVG